MKKWGNFEIKWGLSGCQAWSLAHIGMSEETPYGLCQNRSKIARANGSIFGGTFRRASEGQPEVGGGNDFWDPSPGLSPVDGSGSGVGRRNPLEEDRRAALSSVRARPSGRSSPTAVDRTSFGPDRRGHASDFGPFGCDQEVRPENGTSEPGSGWERQRVGLGIWDDQHRGSKPERDQDRPPLWAVVFANGPRVSMGM